MNLDRPPQSDSAEVTALHKQAMGNLRFIRETMERAACFTAVSGRGMIIMGLTAFLAAIIAAQQSSPEAWLATWLAEALLASLVGIWTIIRKAHKAKIPVLSGTGRKFVLSLCPPMFAGLLLPCFFIAAV